MKSLGGYVSSLSHLDNHGKEGDKSSTKMKIVQCAVDLFATKGFTETSIRDLGNAIGIQGSAIYYHFPSKNAILEYILNDYLEQTSHSLNKPAITSMLENHPTPEGVLATMFLTFPKGREEYYLKVLGVILQEQHRNPLMRDFVTRTILNAELKIRIIFDTLKMMRVFQPDTLPDYWMKIISSLVYAYSSRRMLGIGDNSPEYVGKNMTEMIRTTFELMFEKCVIRQEENES